MKKCLMLFLAAAALSLPAAHTYRYSFTIQGDAQSRILIFFPFRIYYETSVEVKLAADVQPDGRLAFSWLELARPCYILRTLGFSAKTLVMLHADTDLDRAAAFAREKVEGWKRDVPKYSTRIKRDFALPYLLTPAGPDTLRFERSPEGIQGGVRQQAKVSPVFNRESHIYFKVFPILAETIGLFSYSIFPAGVRTAAGPLPAQWQSDPIDLTVSLSRMTGLLERVISEWVTVKQESPFRLSCRLAAETETEWQIECTATPKVALWKNFKIVEYRRRIRIRKSDLLPLSDELFLDLRNKKGHGGFGKMELLLSD